MNWLNGTPACVYMMMLKDGTHYPIWVWENFIANTAILITT